MWARSELYGQSVYLGPVQAAVYRFALDATSHGRRPEYTLAHIASAVGRPVSSVHEALGRLRALGLLGVAARMGRTGGHRLWRIAKGSGVRLDAIRHRMAVARVVRRWYAASVQRATEGDSGRSIPLFPDPSGDDGTGKGASDNPSSPGQSFRDAMRKAGFLPWWRLATDDRGDRDDPGGAGVQADRPAP